MKNFEKNKSNKKKSHEKSYEDNEKWFQEKGTNDRGKVTLTMLNKTIIALNNVLVNL